MPCLHEILRRPLPRTPRAQRYQDALDERVDQMRAEMDVERGLLGSRNVALPHEDVPGYWELDPEARAARTPAEAAAIYKAAEGRAGTGPLATAAFCWYSPLSRHQGDPELLRFFQNGLGFFVDAIREDGLWGNYGLNGHIWAHGWDLENLVYGLVWTGDALDGVLRARTLQRFAVSAQRFFDLGPSGHLGNQAAVQALGLYLYGQLLDAPAFVQLSNTYWEEIADKILDESGQVIEQYGPCMHYSYTAFFYCWLNSFLRGEERSASLRASLLWFRYRHTETLVPMAGPSSRQYRETLAGVAQDLIPACEQVAPENPVFLAFADALFAQAGGGKPASASHHGPSPLIWALLAMSRDEAREPTAAERGAWQAPFTRYYHSISHLGRSPSKGLSSLIYVLVRRQYQTHFNFRDFLPFSGVQTWAFGTEPPIIHPTLAVPSTTQAWGLDTARQGCSRNWGTFGMGAKAIDGWVRDPQAPEEVFSLLARYDQIWRLVVFTDVATVILEFGRQGPRRTSWTLNRQDPVDVEIQDGVVRFAGRAGCLHSTVRAPTLRTLAPGEYTEGVRVLEYECGDGPAFFALSNAAFRFQQIQPLRDGFFTFRDDAGSYRVTLSPRFFAENNSANTEQDPYWLARETVARREG